MANLLLLLLCANPWTTTESPPQHLELFERKPVPDQNQVGKVLPAFASLAAFAKSRHPLLETLSGEQRAALDRLVDLAATKKPERVVIQASEVPAREEGVPADFTLLSQIQLVASTKPHEIRVTAEVCCDGTGKQEDIGLRVVQPVRVRRDGEKRVRELALQWEVHLSRDKHGGAKVTARNATEHTSTEELLAFDELGRLVTRLRWSRSDNELRLLPGIDIQAWTFVWKDEHLARIEGVVVSEDTDTLDLAVVTTTRERGQ